MKGDFTRATFRRNKHYSGVRMQQGRVQLDADWNESIDIATHRSHTQTLDLVGQSGCPITNGGFALTTDIAALPAHQQAAAAQLMPLDPGDFIISAGRYYVEGVLCENDLPVKYSRQPDPTGALLETTPGTYLVYLDVWSHHLTALEDPELREVALGGPDTATRTKTVWQVRLIAVDYVDGGTGEVPPTLVPRSTGRLTARAMPGADETDPCSIEPGAGYRRTENQLYRVEIHEPGPIDTATFKWSRDNGSIVLGWLAQAGNTLTVSGLKDDRSLGLKEGDCLELSDDSHEISGAVGQLVTLLSIDGQRLTVEPKNAIEQIDFTKYPLHPKVRRWSGAGVVSQPGGNDGFVELEGGVEIRFEPGEYKAGDYWLVPARTAIGSIEWPFEEPQAPLGIVHHYCQLALLQYDGTTFTQMQDRRRLMPSLTELTSLFYLSGDGQEASSGLPLPQPLRVGVANGQWPVVGATVRFSVVGGSGKLRGSTGPVDVATDANGVATCEWTLDTQTASQQVQALLIDEAGSPRHLPVRFNATLSSDARDIGIRVLEIDLVGSGALANDSDVDVTRFAKGIAFTCGGAVAPSSIDRATCVATLEMPFPLTPADRALWGPALLGHQPLVLAGTTSVRGAVIQWRPAASVNTWLAQRLFAQLKQNSLQPRLLVRLALHGDFIWRADKPEVALDGDVFGMPVSGTQRTALRLPSGDARRGGDLRMWFWLVEDSGISITISPKTTTLDLGASRQFTAKVAGSANTVVEMSVNGIVNGNKLVGTLKSIKQDVWTYTAPLRMPESAQVTVTATSKEDTTKTASALVKLQS